MFANKRRYPELPQACFDEFGNVYLRFRVARLLSKIGHCMPCIISNYAQVPGWCQNSTGDHCRRCPHRTKSRWLWKNCIDAIKMYAQSNQAHFIGRFPQTERHCALRLRDKTGFAVAAIGTESLRSSCPVRNSSWHKIWSSTSPGHARHFRLCTRSQLAAYPKDYQRGSWGRSSRPLERFCLSVCLCAFGKSSSCCVLIVFLV